jgi:membrane protease YdiL (CAAX protease family)
MFAPPGWYPDPAGAPLLRFWDGRWWTPYTALHPGSADEPPLLDRQIAEFKAADPRPWGTRPVLLPIAGYVAAILLGSVLAAVVDPHGHTAKVLFAAVVNVGLQAVIITAAYRAGRDVARRYGGWGRAFGLRRPRWKDLLIALAGVGLIIAARIPLNVMIYAAGGKKALKQSQNITVDRVDAAVIVFLVLAAVIAAPIVEELVFRGLILRTFLQRMSFWPAALASSAIFAIGHTYEVDTVAGAITLALNVGVIGVVHCGLVRYTGRLAPGMISHAIVNLVAVLALASGVGSGSLLVAG